METQLLHEKLNDLCNRAKPRSHETDKFIARLKAEGVAILSCQLDRQTAIVWIWCQSQTALQYIRRMYESTQLRDEVFENIQPFTSKIINADRNQFLKTAGKYL